MKEKEIHRHDNPMFMVFAEDADAMLQEALIQQSNPMNNIETAREFAKQYKGTCYIFQQLEQHYEKP